MRLDQFFSPERAASMQQYMKNFALQFGVTDFRQPQRIPNTRRALALAEVARQEGKLDAFRQRAMDAHWRDGMDLENDDDLGTIARDAGLQQDTVESRHLERVDAIREEADRIGITGIPTFVIGNFALSGCQPYETLAAFAKKASLPAL